MRQIAAYRGAARAADILLTEDFNVCFFLNKGVMASMLAGGVGSCTYSCKCCHGDARIKRLRRDLFLDDFDGYGRSYGILPDEAGRLSKWKTSMTVIALVTLIAAVHYFYMRDVWVETGESPTVYRYVDWLIIVPLQMVEFYFIWQQLPPSARAFSGGFSSDRL